MALESIVEITGPECVVESIVAVVWSLKWPRVESIVAENL